MIGFVGSFDRHTDVVGLLLGQLRELHTDTGQMETCHLFIQILRQAIDPDLVGLLPEIDLSQHLIGEGVAHDERGMTGCTAQVHQTTLGQQEDGVTVWEGELIHLRLDVQTLDAGEVL